MRSEYLIWKREIVEGACTLSGMTGFDDDWKLLYGVPVADSFPSRARFAMNPDMPDDVKLIDALPNRDMLIVASKRLRDLIESMSPPSVEYHPVPIYDHKKRRVKEAYFIVHPIEPPDCLDAKASGAVFSKIDKQSISSVKRLVIDEARVPAERLIFRTKTFPDLVLVKRSLARAIDDAGITGVRWVELGDFKG